jgi:hypothetical protein
MEGKFMTTHRRLNPNARNLAAMWPKTGTPEEAVARIEAVYGPKYLADMLRKVLWEEAQELVRAQERFAKLVKIARDRNIDPASAVQWHELGEGQSGPDNS